MVVGFCQPLLYKHMGNYEEIDKYPTVQYTAGGSGKNSLRYKLKNLMSLCIVKKVSIIF